MPNNIMSELILCWKDGTNETKRRVLKLADLPLKIGRESTNDIWLYSKQVTREHAQISVWGGRFWIEDLGSRNGVLINNKRITEKTLLEDGMTFGIPPFVFSVTINAGIDDAETEINFELVDDETEPYIGYEQPSVEDVTIPYASTPRREIRLAWSISESSENDVQEGDFRVPVSIGRDGDSTIQLLHQAISRQHALIELLDGALAIIDQGSRNGLEVNGHQQSEAYLHKDDEIKMGPYTLRVLYVDPAQEASSPYHKPDISLAKTVRGTLTDDKNLAQPPAYSFSSDTPKL